MKPDVGHFSFVAELHAEGKHYLCRMSAYKPSRVSSSHLHFILTANWPLCGVLEELASRLVAR